MFIIFVLCVVLTSFWSEYVSANNYIACMCN